MRIGPAAVRALLRHAPTDRELGAVIDRLPGAWRRGFGGVVDVRNGAQFWIDDLRDVIQQRIYYRGTYEHDITREILGLLRPDDVFVDVGANLGWFAVNAGIEVGPLGRVIAVEPVEANVARLRRNADLNRLTNIDVRAVAATSANGEFPFATGDEGGQAGWGALAEHGKLKVLGRPLDDLLADVARSSIRCLKIDVEGGEPGVLAGATSLLHDAEFRPAIFVEVNRPRLATRGLDDRSVVNPLEAAGWRLRRAFPDIRADVHTCAFVR